MIKFKLKSRNNFWNNFLSPQGIKKISGINEKIRKDSRKRNK
jgi:hypothetical protein